MDEIEIPFKLNDTNQSPDNLPPSGTVVQTSAGLRFALTSNPRDLRRLTDRQYQEGGTAESKEVNLSEYTGKLIYVEGNYDGFPGWVHVQLIGNEEVFRALEREEVLRASERVVRVLLSTTGNQERWRDTRDFRGAEKYSNWSITTRIFYYLPRQAIRCDYIKVTRCNFTLTGNPFTTERSDISFTTRNGHGWDNCNFTLEFKCDGQIYSCSISCG